MGFVLAAGTLALAAACGDEPEQRAAPDTPVAREIDSTEALAYMAAVNQGAVQTAQIGTRRASSTEVRQFAQLLWREHAQSGRDVAELARQLEIDLRTVAPAASPLITNLRTRTQQTTQLLDRTPRSSEFDRTYVDSEIRAHQALLQDLRRVIGDSNRVSATVAPGGGVDVGVTGRVDAAEAAAAASRAANRKPENPLDAARLMLTQVQQHLDRARQLQARLSGRAVPDSATSSPPARNTARAPRPRRGARP